MLLASLVCTFLYLVVTPQGRELAIVDISKATSIISEDVIDTMTRLGLLKYSDGEHQIVATPVRLSPLSLGQNLSFFFVSFFSTSASLLLFFSIRRISSSPVIGY